MTVEFEEIPGRGENISKDLEARMCKVHLRNRKLSSLAREYGRHWAVTRDKAGRRCSENNARVENQTEVSIPDSEGNKGTLNILKQRPCMILVRLQKD